MKNNEICTKVHNYLLQYVGKTFDISWKIIDKINIDDIIIYHISLTLKSFPYSNIARNIQLENLDGAWNHTIFIYVPKIVNTNRFFMKAGSGKLGEVQKFNEILIDISRTFDIICIEAFDIPNQPLSFNNSGDINSNNLYEDSLMAYSWRMYKETGQFDQVINFHMVKSIVEIMKFCDMFAQSYLELELSNDHKYILYGASKRALAIWLTASVCGRIEAIIPAVFDALNIRKTIINQKDKMGFYSNKLKNYVENGLLDDELEHHLFDIIDPLNYDQYITVPKFIINVGNDNFFTPDSSNYYFHSVRETKYLRYIPNTDHNMATESLKTHLKNICNTIINKDFLKYEIENIDNNIFVKTDEIIIQMNVWYAENNKFDFGINQFVPYQCINLDQYINGNLISVKINDILKKQLECMVYMIEITFYNNFVVTSPIYVY